MRRLDPVATHGRPGVLGIIRYYNMLFRSMTSRVVATKFGGGGGIIVLCLSTRASSCFPPLSLVWSREIPSFFQGGFLFSFFSCLGTVYFA